MCSTRNFVPGMTWRSPCFHQNSTDVSAGKCRRNDFTSTTTRFVLSQGYFRQCCRRKLALSRSHAVVSGTPMWFAVVGHGLGLGGVFHFWITAQKDVVSCWKRGQEGFVPCCTKVLMLGQVNVAVSGQNTFIQSLPRAALSVYLWRLQRILVWELLTLRSLVDQNQWWTLCLQQWSAHLALAAYVAQALIARTDLPTYATLVTHESFSEKDDSILHIHHLCRIASYRDMV